MNFIKSGLMLFTFVGMVIAADFQTSTQKVASVVVIRDTLELLLGEKDTSKIFIIDKYNNKVISIVIDDTQNSGNNSGDEYNVDIRILQGVRLLTKPNANLYLTPSKSSDSLIGDDISNTTADTTHFTSQGMFYHNMVPDYTRACAIEISANAGTRAAGDKVQFFVLVSQRIRN